MTTPADPKPPADPQNPAAPDPQPPAPPPADPPDPEPFAVFKTSDDLNKRLAQAARSQLREMGFEDPNALKDIVAEHKKLQDEAEKQRQAQMSELEREREQRQALERQAEEAMSAAEAAELRAHLYSVFAEKGVRNFDYALWEVSSKLEGLGEDEELDERAYLDELLADPVKAAALGIASVSTQGVTTTVDDKGPQAKPPGGGTQGDKDVFSMTPEQFRKHLEGRGVSV